jgi:serine/threonine-protein kinase
VNAEQWAEVEMLFADALERDPDSRAGFVRERAGGAEVAEEVLSLLDAHGREGVFDGLAARQETLDRTESAALGPGVRVGAWEVVEELGHGGMGEVYLARRADGQFEQEAALKILAGDLSRPDVRSRFLSERQILASLEHPSIARLLDGGAADDGRPYFVLEHVDGVPIDAYCDEKRLGVADRLRLFVSVCEAVQFAHQNLVVHRDLKPANILITPDGMPKLLDFGIAKLLGEHALGGAPTATQVGVLALTPDYASPEQFRGVTVTPASDVYQLGILLYELLVGARPTHPTVFSPEDVEVAVAARARTRPSTAATDSVSPTAADIEGRAAARGSTPGRLSRRLRGDLDDIVMKALRPEPESRYGTAAQLADDVERHLQGRPVRARPDTFVYRTRKFAGRNAVALSTAVAVFLMVTGFAIGMRRQATRTAMERDRAEQVIDFMVELFRSSDPTVTQGDSVTVREILDRGAERVRDELAGQPEVQVALMGVMGDAYDNLGLLEPARDLFRDAIDVHKSRVGADDADLARTVRRLAMVEARSGHSDAADTLLADALDRLRRTGEPGTAEYAAALNGIGYAWQVQADRDRAEPLLEEALTMYEGLPEPDPAQATTLLNLGWLRRAARDPDSAEVFFRRALEFRREVVGPEHTSVASVLEALGGLLTSKGSFAAADSAFTEALRIQRRVLPEGHPTLYGLLHERGNLLRLQGRAAEAEPVLRQALEGSIAAFGEEHFVVAGVRNTLALALQDLGRDEEAAVQMRLSWIGYRARFGPEHVNPALVELNLARHLQRMGSAEAEERFAHGLSIARAAFPENRRYLGDLVTLGLLRCQAGRLDRALSDLETAVDDLTPEVDPPAPDDYLRALNALGSCLAQHGRTEEAVQALNRSLDASSDRGDDDPYRTFATDLLGTLAGVGPDAPGG